MSENIIINCLNMSDILFFNKVTPEKLVNLLKIRFTILNKQMQANWVVNLRSYFHVVHNAETNLLMEDAYIT